MHVAVLVVILGWAGATLMLDAWIRRQRRPDLAERLLPYRPRSLGDDAQDWLDNEA
jgi:hypothetical protein